MAALSQLQRLVVPQTGRHTASIIFLHGSGQGFAAGHEHKEAGDTGQGIRAWVKDVLSKDLIFPHIRVIYPTAPLRPYTPMNGALSTVWFDRTKIVNNCPEHLTSIDLMCQLLDGLVGEEVKAGIPKERIIIGGFSMGGCMAMHLAYRFHQQVAGVFALSSFLNNNSVVYQAAPSGRPGATRDEEGLRSFSYTRCSHCCAPPFCWDMINFIP
eukprot:gi/632972545/ref/XP_007902711.1/ PREDICTED: lysophospholipase-like protein 1 isoform X5 [Callorhinchus milii]